MPLKCPKGTIKRVSYKKKSFKRKDGTVVKSTRIGASCIKDRGKPGKGPRLIGSLRKGTLRKFGYKASKRTSVRRKSLKKAMKKEHPTSVFRKLRAVGTLLRNTAPEMSRRVIADSAWVKRTKEYANR